MAYELHIQRTKGKISLHEWKTFISTTPGVRPSTGSESVRLPDGTTLAFPHHDGDADAQLSGDKDQSWQPVFRWTNGSVSFRTLTEDNSDPIWQLAASLASQLGATISGDDGEQYDLKTREVLTDP